MIDTDLVHNIAAGRAAPPHLVSLVIPHYETPELVRLCLRAVRRYTTVPFEALVIDNASTDGASLEYLRRVSWIRLIERPADTVPDNGPGAHATALDLGLAEARGEFLLAMHTDTIPRREGWLKALLEPFAGDPKMAVVGADKLTAPPPAIEAVKRLVNGKTYRRLALQIMGREVPPTLAAKRSHARSYCAVYRRQVLLDELLGFQPGPGTAAGEGLYHALLARGYHGRLLRASAMRQLVEHVVHATAYLSAGRGIRTGRVRRRTARRIERLLGSPWVKALEADETLDTQ
jgi:Glycosyl transferase family 2